MKTPAERCQFCGIGSNPRPSACISIYIVIRSIEPHGDGAWVGPRIAPHPLTLATLDSSPHIASEEIKWVPVRGKAFTHSVISITRKCLRNSVASQRSHCSMSARSRAAQFATRVRGATLSKPRASKLSSKKSCLVFVVPPMSVPCTLLRFKPKEEAFACGNARNVARRGRMRGPRARWGKRWERDLLLVPFAGRLLRAGAVSRLVRPCPRLHPGSQF